LIQISQCVGTNLRSQTQISGAVDSLVPGQRYCIFNANWQEYLTVTGSIGSYFNINGEGSCTQSWYLVQNSDGSYGLGAYDASVNNDVWLSVTSTNANTVRGTQSPASWEELAITNIAGGYNWCIYGKANNRYVSMFQSGNNYPLTLKTSCTGGWEVWNFIPQTTQVTTVVSGQVYCIYNPFWGRYLGLVPKETLGSTYMSVQGTVGCTYQWQVGSNSDGTFYLMNIPTYEYLSITSNTQDTTTLATSVGSWEHLQITGSSGTPSTSLCIKGVANNYYSSMYQDGSTYYVNINTSCGPYQTWNFFSYY